jgi:hypothetical protein
MELTDAMRIQSYLLIGVHPLPAPGPRACGAEPTPNALEECRGECR